MKMRRRHPAEVTADRVADHLQRYYDELSPQEADLLTHTAITLRRLAIRSATSAEEA